MIAAKLLGAVTQKKISTIKDLVSDGGMPAAAMVMGAMGGPAALKAGEVSPVVQTAQAGLPIKKVKKALDEDEELPT